mgnify:CR=1 FL=1|tara:strand:+ start:777 stop:2333 length:1557 start_codon:yes stop_codon:yes gene_type:complete
MSNTEIDAWRTWQSKIAVSSDYTKPKVSQIGSGDPNLRQHSNQQETPRQLPTAYTEPSYNNTIIENERKILTIDSQLNNVITKKDELKLIEANKVGARGSVVQIKTTQNNAYRDLQSTESQLMNEKIQLQQEINIAKDKIQQGGLDSQAGEQFSAGIGLDPVMDQDRVVQDVPTAPAMNPLERAQYFDKEDTLLNPQFTMEDVAQGLTEQGASYLGGDNTILDKAVASPILDIQHGLSNPSEYQLAQDYGYTNMDASAKEIAQNPARFTGNVAGFVGAEVALTFGTLGVGKIALKGGKIISTAVNNSNANKFVKKDIENINKELGLGNDKSITNEVQNSKKLVDEIDPYSSKALNPSGTVNLQSLQNSRNARSTQYAVRQVEGEAHEIEKTDILEFRRDIIKKLGVDEKIPELQTRIWNNYDNIVTGKLLPVASVKTGWKKQGKEYLESLKSAKSEFEEFGTSTGIKKKPPTVFYNTQFGKTLTGVAGASVIAGATSLSDKKKKGKPANFFNLGNFKY